MYQDTKQVVIQIILTVERILQMLKNLKQVILLRAVWTFTHLYANIPYDRCLNW